MAKLQKAMGASEHQPFLISLFHEVFNTFPFLVVSEALGLLLKLKNLTLLLALLTSHMFLL